jgi:hypothetical protein
MEKSTYEDVRYEVDGPAPSPRSAKPDFTTHQITH